VLLIAFHDRPGEISVGPELLLQVIPEVEANIRGDDQRNINLNKHLLNDRTSIAQVLRGVEYEIEMAGEAISSVRYPHQ
jgi:hypothetical protein